MQPNGAATGNNYYRAEGQNVGNFMTDRPSSRVLAPPGGGSQISFGNEAAPTHNTKVCNVVRPPDLQPCVRRSILTWSCFLCRCRVRQTRGQACSWGEVAQTVAATTTPALRAKMSATFSLTGTPHEFLLPLVALLRFPLAEACVRKRHCGLLLNAKACG